MHNCTQMALDPALSFLEVTIFEIRAIIRLVAWELSCPDRSQTPPSRDEEHAGALNFEVFCC